jgi:hypothetical protein
MSCNTISKDNYAVICISVEHEHDHSHQVLLMISQ